MPQARTCRLEGADCVSALIVARHYPLPPGLTPQRESAPAPGATAADPDVPRLISGIDGRLRKLLLTLPSQAVAPLPDGSP